MIGHGDYIAAMINDMSRLSVTSSNSLRKSSPSARKRAQSLGRLGEVSEGDPYQYESLTQDDEEEEDADQDHWAEKARNIHSETNTPYLGVKKSVTLQPNGILPKAKSTYEVGSHPVTYQNVAAPSYGAYMSGELGSPQERVIWKRDVQLPRGMPPSQRPIACFYSPSVTVHQPLGDPTPVSSEARPTLPTYLHTQDSPGRPFSSYDLKVSDHDVSLIGIVASENHQICASPSAPAPARLNTLLAVRCSQNSLFTHGMHILTLQYLNQQVFF